MADGDLKFRFLADTQQAEANFTRLEKKLDDQERKLKQISQQSRKGANQSNSDFKQMAAGAASLAGSLGLVTSISGAASAAVAMIRAEFEDLLNRQREAAQLQQTFAQAFDSALLNLGTEFEAADLESLIKRISDKTGADRKNVAVSLSNALSAKGDLGVEDVEQAVTATLQLTRNVPEAQAPLAGATLDLQKNFKADADAAIGFLLETGQQARVTSAQLIAQNIAPAIVGISSAGGDSPREAAALTAALTQATADATGASGATAAIQLDRQLEVALPELKNLTERIQFLQQNEDARQAFLKGGKLTIPTDGGPVTRQVKAASFKVKSAAAVESLLEGGKTQDLFQNAFNNISEVEDAATTFKRKQEQIAATSFRGNIDAQAMFKSKTEGFAIEDVEGGQAAVAREGLEQSLKAAGVGAMDRWVAQGTFELHSNFGTNDPMGVTSTILENTADAYRERGVFSGPSNSDLKSAAILQEIADNLKQQTAMMQREEQTARQPPVQPPRQVNRNANTE